MIILAGSYQQFLYYCQRNKLNPQEHVYPKKREDLFGHSPHTTIVKAGRWWENSLAREAMEIFKFGKE